NRVPAWSTRTPKSGVRQGFYLHRADRCDSSTSPEVATDRLPVCGPEGHSVTMRDQLEPGLLIHDASQISADWLASVLGERAVTLHEVARIGTGQMSLTYRATYATGADPAASVVVKLAAEDEASRATGVNFGIYRREILFYQRLSAGLTGPPKCLFAEYDDGWFTLVLDDAPEAVQGDQIAGCDATTARLVIDTLAAMHAPAVN